jgi:hypothetical protein
MSHQSFRKKTRKVLTNMDLKFIQASENTYRTHTSTHLNTPDVCKVCGGGRAYDIETQRTIPLVGHHVKYFPPVITFVHYDCHKKIHDKNNPIKKFIQYTEGDANKYYELKTKALKSCKIY